MKKYAIIVAGGKGLRMGQDLPKQFISVGEKPILMHTLNAFYRTNSEIDLILVLPKEQVEYWITLCELYNFKIPHRIAEGGATRFNSVRNGLKLVEAEGVVAIHDGVRPFVSSKVISDAYGAAKDFPGVIPVIEVVDSVRELDDQKGSHPVDRERLRLVQTPQVFQTAPLLEAYQLPYDKSFTDDASVFEAAGFQVHCIAGNRENIKITTPFDLLIAEALIQ
ncbi:MAG: 2-C-methyl-D-erythritol 4-phosphate cytidylyltransferase [Bacteroidales bacterium]